MVSRVFHGISHVHLQASVTLLRCSFFFTSALKVSVKDSDKACAAFILSSGDALEGRRDERRWSAHSPTLPLMESMPSHTSDSGQLKPLDLCRHVVYTNPVASILPFGLASQRRPRLAWVWAASSCTAETCAAASNFFFTSIRDFSS